MPVLAVPAPLPRHRRLRRRRARTMAMTRWIWDSYSAQRPSVLGSSQYLNLAPVYIKSTAVHPIRAVPFEHVSGGRMAAFPNVHSRL